jgi:hypothetical protein
VLHTEVGTVGKEPRFAVQQFKTFGRYTRWCRIVDIHRTYNLAGELVKVRYVATYDLHGQTTCDMDVEERRVAIGLRGDDPGSYPP